MNPKPLLYLCFLALTQCSKCKKDDPAPAEQLPPATQTGANTFGCLVNGQAWTSKTSSGYGAYLVQYEPGVNNPLGGNLNIRLTSDNNKMKVFLSAGPIFRVRSFALDSAATEGTASYFDRDRAYPCNEVLNYDATYLTGNLTLTRLDEQAGVISGTFEFKLAKPGCDTIRVTQGRFDHRI